jgi:hypothetical protein
MNTRVALTTTTTTRRLSHEDRLEHLERLLRVLRDVSVRVHAKRLGVRDQRERLAVLDIRLDLSMRGDPVPVDNEKKRGRKRWSRSS